MKRRYPNRVLLYGGVEPVGKRDRSRELERMERQVEEASVSGFKFYPSGGYLRTAMDANQAVSSMTRSTSSVPRTRSDTRCHSHRHAQAVPARPGPVASLRPDDHHRGSSSLSQSDFRSRPQRLGISR